MRKYIFVLLTALVVLAGCKNKHTQVAQVPETEHGTTPVIDQPAIDQPVIDQPEAEPEVEPEFESEQVEIPAHTSLQARLNVTLSFRDHVYTSNAALSVKTGSLMVVSLTPVLGIEVYRLEATPEGVTLLDKLNRRVAVASWIEISEMTRRPMDYATVERILYAHADDPSHKYDLPGFGSVQVRVLSMAYDQPNYAAPLSQAGYSPIDLNTLLSGKLF